jgi:outer membrane receptor protein involved in Fe transport
VIKRKRQHCLSVFLLLLSFLVNAKDQQLSTTDEDSTKNKFKTFYRLKGIEIKGKHLRNLLKVPLAEPAPLEVTTTIVNEQEIIKQGSEDVIDALRFVPGALIETRGRKVKQFFSVRGQRYPYPGYAVNGIWQREFHETPYFFSSSEIDRIEVIRSSSAMLKGPTSLSGIVNIIPKIYENPETSIMAEYGTFSTSRFYLSHGNTKNSISYVAGLSYYNTEGPEDKHASESMVNFRGHLGWQLRENLAIQSDVYHLYGNRELAQAESPAALKFREALQKYDPFKSTLFTVKGNYKASENASTQILLHYTNRDHIFIDESEDTTLWTPGEYNEKDHEWGINLVQTLSPLKDNILRLGGFYNHWVAPNGKRFYFGNRCDVETFSTVLVDEHRIGSLLLDAGVRWTRNYLNEYAKAYDSYNLDGSPQIFTGLETIKNQWERPHLTYTLGGVYYISNFISVNTNISYNTIQPRTGALDVDLEEPEDEKQLKIDLGIQAYPTHIGRFSLTGFYTKRSNAIVLSGNTYEMEGRIIELYKNQDRDKYGIEFTYQSEPIIDIARIFFNITAMKPRARIEGGYVRNEEVPMLIGGGGIYAKSRNIDLNIFWKYISSYQSSRFVPGSLGPQPLGDFFNLDLTLGWSLDKEHHSRLYMKGHNLFDSKFSTVVGYPDFGREFNLGLSYIFY